MASQMRKGPNLELAGVFQETWRTLASASDELGAVPSYRFDLVDVAREVMLGLARAERRRAGAGPSSRAARWGTPVHTPAGLSHGGGLTQTPSCCAACALLARFYVHLGHLGQLLGHVGAVPGCFQ